MIGKFIRRRKWHILFSVLAMVFVYWLCQYRVVFLSNEAHPIIVKWFYIPQKGMFESLFEKFESDESRIWRNVVYGYSLEKYEIDKIKSGVVPVYSTLTHKWGHNGAAGMCTIEASLWSKKIYSWLGDGHHLKVINPEPEEVYSWDGRTTHYIKVTAELSHWKQRSELKISPSSWLECQFSSLRENDVFVIFDICGLFVRSPGDYSFYGYKWRCTL